MRKLWKKFTDAIGAFIMAVKNNASSGGGGGKPDQTPDAFVFAAVTSAELSTEYISNEITITGINKSVSVSVSGGSYQKNGGAWATGNTTAVAGDRFRVKRTSAAVNSTGASAVLTVGGVVGNYSITTKSGVVLPPPDPSGGMQIGMNLTNVTYYSPEVPFIDVFKMAPGWAGRGSGNSAAVALDANGWPVSMVPTSGGTPFTQIDTGFVQELPAPYYRGGRYVVHYDGDGSINYINDAVRDAAASAPGRDVLNVTPSVNGIRIAITQIGPDPVRNVRVCHENNEAALLAGEIIDPTLVGKLDPFKALRFMDWGETNVIAAKDWAGRTKLSDPFWGQPVDGVAPIVNARAAPVEVMVELCNKTGADLYICMPYLATDDYLQQCATLVDSRLRSDLKCYVEFGNEFFNVYWDPSNSGHFFVPEFLTQAKVAYPGVANFSAAFDWALVRAVKTADIWSAVSDRFVPVMASQAAYDGRVAYQLDFADARYFSGAAGAHFKALATAPYFGSTSGDNSNLTLDQFFQEIMTGGTGAVGGYPGGWIRESFDWAVANKAQANRYGLRLIAYEGGQHFVDYSGNNATLQSLYQSANSDPRMSVAYTTYLNKMKEAGFDLFITFNSVGKDSRWGYWGAWQNVMTPSSPKGDALVAFANAV